MPEVSKDWNPVAFKEWQTVCDALETGEQRLILRKGGISEGKLGFQWLHDRFFLFPTYYHEQVEQVKPDGAGRPRALRDEIEGGAKIAIRLFAETERTERLTDREAVEALRPEHIWIDRVIEDRFSWGDEPGISVAWLKVYRLAEPWILEDRKGFGGCRSWIGLPGEGDEVAARLRDAVAVG